MYYENQDLVRRVKYAYIITSKLVIATKGTRRSTRSRKKNKNKTEFPFRWLFHFIYYLVVFRFLKNWLLLTFTLYIRWYIFLYVLCAVLLTISICSVFSLLLFRFYFYYYSQFQVRQTIFIIISLFSRLLFHAFLFKLTLWLRLRRIVLYTREYRNFSHTCMSTHADTHIHTSINAHKHTHTCINAHTYASTHDLRLRTHICGVLIFFASLML